MDNDLTQNLQQAKAAAAQLDDALQQLDKTFAKLDDSRKEFSKTFAELSNNVKNGSTNIQTIADALKKANLQFDENAAVLDKSNGSLQQNKAVLNGLLMQYQLLSEGQGNNSKEVQALNVKIGQLSNTIESQETKLAKSREAFDAHKQSATALGSAFDGIKGKAGELDKTFGPALESASSGFNAMKTGLSAVKTGFNGVGNAIKTTGFGLLVLALQSVVEYFTNTTEGAAKLKQILAGITTVINIVKSGFAGFGKTIIEAFSHPVDTIKSLWSNLIENITNRVKAFGAIGNAIMDIFSGHFSAKKLADGFIQLGSGITNATDKMTNSIKNTQAFLTKSFKDIKDAYQTGVANDEGLTKELEKNNQKQSGIHKQKVQRLKQITEATKQSYEERIASIAHMGQKVLEGYAKEVSDADTHFKELQDKYKANQDTVEQLEQERVATLITINKKYQDDDLKKLDDYQRELLSINRNAAGSARRQALQQLQDTYREKAAILDKEVKDAEQRRAALNGQTSAAALAAAAVEDGIIKRAAALQAQLSQKLETDQAKTNHDFDYKNNEESLQNGISAARDTGHQSAAMQQELALLKLRHDAEVNAAEAAGKDTLAINARYAKEKADLENQLTESRIHAGDRLIDAVLKNTKKDTAAFKAAFMAKKATSIAEVIMSTKKAMIASFEGYASMPFIGQALAIAQAAFIGVQGAASIAEISKQKPGYARGGQYISDGKGALLPGYSRHDNTNAYLRSGEAVVVSEAMRNPWARNLVSAINVMHGGRDFSIANPGRGYAIGGVFTDGGNANRYYSQPAQDQKNLANTIAYQMINNFPPVYVDVKDINTQQNILAQTVNRVNL